MAQDQNQIQTVNIHVWFFCASNATILLVLYGADGVFFFQNLYVIFAHILQPYDDNFQRNVANLPPLFERVHNHIRPAEV